MNTPLIFQQGLCLIYAEALQEKYGGQIVCILESYLEGDEWDNIKKAYKTMMAEEVNAVGCIYLTHAYLEKQTKEKTIYIDVRGISTDKKQFEKDIYADARSFYITQKFKDNSYKKYNWSDTTEMLWNFGLTYELAKAIAIEHVETIR